MGETLKTTKLYITMLSVIVFLNLLAIATLSTALGLNKGIFLGNLITLIFSSLTLVGYVSLLVLQCTIFVYEKSKIRRGSE